MDTGDSLFPNGLAAPNEADRRRADLIARTMGQLHYDAMVVGEHDLDDGLAKLQALAGAAHLTLLSANLADAQGKHPFAATKLLDTPRGKVGLFGVELVGADKAGLHAEDPAAAARKCVDDLRNAGAQVIVALVHGPGFDAPRFLRELHLDVALYGHDGRVGTVAPGPPGYAAGQKGRSLAKVAVELGIGPVTDGSVTEDAGAEVRLLDELYQKLQERRAAATTDQARSAMAAQMKLNRERREQAAARAKVQLGRTARLSYLNLDDSVKADPELQKAVDAEVAQDGHSPMH